MRKSRLADHQGFKLVELLVVLALISVLSAMSIPYILNYKKLYKSEEQAMKIMDLMREANQLALTKRKTMRLEFDLTENAVLLIDEDGTNPDRRLKKVPLEPTKDIRIDVIPSGVSKPNPPNYSDITFAADAIGHLSGTTTITGHNVWAARFKSDGSVVNAANNPISVNIYVWPPSAPGSNTPRNTNEVRAITMFGGSGAIRYWRFNNNTFTAHQ